ncbi:LOW QUALITY PROTEIN: uncharacterized protein LOC143201686 [Rhynchophorus ferrugineus]|uniref:LOW QUALITY PROTEIN: uncharacterized protein LOC143201686 n=1 Tax=Rhynchophorus ferrugineus TaxID=354439 RepID=UPI003FCCE143
MRVSFVFCSILICLAAGDELTDFGKCKVSGLGVEYTGEIAKTESGVRCQSWSMELPHKIDTNLTDDKFPDGSKKAARNYCRNPDRRPDGPWCYTISADLIYETCAIPFCSFSQCRATGPGSEYGGVHRRTVSGRKCLKWDKDRSKVLIGGNYTKVVKANRSSFPENSASKAKNYCRNPSGDLGGPWCLVENDEQDYIEKEYCDIPFCDDRECSVFARNYQTYTHYTDFNGSAMASLKFDLKLWNSDDFNNASARLVLSVLALPLTGKEIDVLGVGVEIFISNKQSGLRFGNKDKPDFEDTPGLLTSTNFTTFALSWDRGFITFGVEGRMRPIFLAEIRTKNNLLGFQRDKFDFYSVQGTNVLWNIPFCLEDDECDVHTTTGGLFQRFWPLRQKDIVYDLYLYVRAFHSASLLITASPVSDYPHFKMVLYGPNGFTRFTVKEHEGASEIVLKEIQLEDIVSYWEWSEFSVSFFANSLQIYMKKAIGMHSILEEKHDIFRTLRWFSVGSANGVAHWSFYCAPPEFARPPVALLPECALNPNEPDYKGTQDVTSSGLPCLPWSGAKMLPPEAEGMYPDWTARLQARNYCRDPVGGGQGTFCYALSRNSTKTIEKRFCRLRRCKSQLCKMAGTGNDFIGQVSVTRGNRMCDSWDPNPETAVHFNYMFTFNDSYFAEMKASDARNFCRNPSRDVSGSWCYTTDPEVVQDLCGIKDCDKPEECTVIVSGSSKGDRSRTDRKIYVLPQWKEEGLHGGLRFSLKEWNPDLLSGFSFSLYPRNGRGEIELIIGADMNEKVELYLNGKLMEKKTFPHLILAGKWTDFWLQVRKGIVRCCFLCSPLTRHDFTTGEVLLGFKGVPTALFEWKHQQSSEVFEPAFLSYRTLYDTMPIGVFFDVKTRRLHQCGISDDALFQCEECHTENTTEGSFLNFLPVGLHSTEENTVHRNLTLKIRGVGIAWISFTWVTNNFNSYLLKIDALNDVVGFYRVEPPPRSMEGQMFPLVEVPVPHPIIPTNWSHLLVAWTERRFYVELNHEPVFHHDNDRPLLLYWFSVAAAAGWITWSANCEPLDLDGPPVDGGWSEWSPWSCTVSCGGGEGYRTRTCSNPHPNIFGKLCQGAPTATGQCNDFPCGDISPDTLDLIHKNLQSNSYSFLVDEDSAVLLRNERELLKQVKKESPEAFVEWTLNGIFIGQNRRVSFEGDDISIRQAKPSDAGTYVCMVYRINQRRVVLKVITLAVKSRKFDVDTRATWSYTLQCHSVILGYVYTDLSLMLMLNGGTYLDYGTTTLAAVNSHTLDPLNRSHTGNWSCVVQQKDLGLKWTTNYVRVNVKKRPNFYTNLMEDRLTAPLFGHFRSEDAVLAALIVFTVFVFLLTVVFLFVYFKYCSLRSRYKRNRRM